MGGGSLPKNAWRDINLTNKRSGLLDSALPLARTMTPPSPVYHSNQLQVLTQYFITVVISRLPTGFWPTIFSVNQTCWVSHARSARLHTASCCDEPRLSLQARPPPARPRNSRPRSVPFSQCGSCFPLVRAQKSLPPESRRFQQGYFGLSAHGEEIE